MADSNLNDENEEISGKITILKTTMEPSNPVKLEIDFEQSWRESERETGM